MLFRARLPAVVASMAAAQSYGNASGPVVDLGYAKYRGNTTFRGNYSVDAYYGIRFAHAPVGALRWQPPQNIESHNDYDPSNIIDAQAPSPSCVQGTPAWRAWDRHLPDPVPVTGQEDCLLLDLYVPSQPKSDYLPIMVMIHGGGYTQGSAYTNPGQGIVGASNGSMIYVSTQYRLGAFGFLSSSEIKENGVANAGLLDQRAALNWIQRNARTFGGDPSQVTIIGGSAGGGAVTNQMILYGGVSNPPFRAAIAEYPWWQPFHNNTILAGQYRDLLATTKCTDLVCLRGLDTEALQIAAQKTYINAYNAQPLGLYAYGDFYYGPSVDGNIIRDLPSNEFKQGHFTKVPLLTDHNGYEGYLYTNRSETTLEQETTGLQQLFPYAKQSFFDRAYQLFPREDYNSTLFQRSFIFGNFIIKCPTYYISSAIADAGLPAYKLIFNAGTQLHGATAPFIFDTGAVNNATLASIMKDWFISFVVSGDPNAYSYSGVEKPHWPMYNPKLGSDEDEVEFATMDVNYTQMGVMPDLDATPQCDFFHGRSYEVRN